MSIGFCPSCGAALEDNNVLITDESKIFKGHNKYAMCKHCGYVMIYNETRGILYSLDKYKEDNDVLLEVASLLKDVDPMLELVDDKPVEEEHKCTHDCNNCSGCGSHKEQEEKEPPLKLSEDSIIMIHKTTGKQVVITENELLDYLRVHGDDELDNYNAFILAPVYIEPVITYKIHRM